MSDEQRVPAPNNPHDQLEESIPANSPRLGLQDTFAFKCYPGVSCFNQCCTDVNIVLSPYDVLRMKKRLGITSGEFLKKYTLLPVHKDMKIPIVLLRMKDDESKSCSFLSDQGCSVYADRPWPCRMYPLGLAAQKDTPDGWRGERFYFLLKEDVCKGHHEPQEQTVRQWLDDQGLDEYDQWGEAFKELTLHEYFENGSVLSPEKMHMLYTACYDLDKFREFVFNSTLLQRFEVDEDFVEEMRYDDEALLRFAFLWLRFSLFGERTVKVNADVLEAFQGKLDKKDLFGEELVEAAKEETR
jgi:Fe-S-cluster containining protein